jgi:hypothetical protein
LDLQDLVALLVILGLKVLKDWLVLGHMVQMEILVIKVYLALMVHLVYLVRVCVIEKGRAGSLL